MVFELFFSDLTPEAQQRLLDTVGIKDPKEANWDMDIFPITILEFEDGAYADDGGENDA